MIYTKLTKKALSLAYKLHGKDFDEYNLPVIFNVFVVADKIDEEYGVCAALLYQAVEDKKISLNNLKKDFPFEVTDTIFILLTDDALAYPDYIRRIKTNSTATKIKIYEIEENIKKLKLEPKENKTKLERFKFALNILKK